MPRKRWKKATNLKTYLEPEEVSSMEEEADNLRDRLLIRLLFRLGCRISEALALTPNDIDFDRGSVTIMHLKSRTKLSCPECGARLGINHTFCSRCGGKIEKALTQQQEHRRQRVLPLDNDTLSLLREYIRRGGPVIRDGKKLIFGINRHRSWQVIRDCAEKARLPKLVTPETGKIHNISPHRLRDAFAVHAVKLDDSGDGLRLLQEHLGHASFNTTAKYRKYLWSYRRCCEHTWLNGQLIPAAQLAGTIQVEIGAKFPHLDFGVKVGMRFNSTAASCVSTWLHALDPPPFTKSSKNLQPRLVQRFELALLALDDTYRSRQYRYGDAVLMDDSLINQIAGVLFIDTKCCADLLRLSANVVSSVKMSDTLGGASINLLRPFTIDNL